MDMENSIAEEATNRRSHDASFHVVGLSMRWRDVVARGEDPSCLEEARGSHLKQ